MGGKGKREENLKKELNALSATHQKECNNYLLKCTKKIKILEKKEKNKSNEYVLSGFLSLFLDTHCKGSYHS